MAIITSGNFSKALWPGVNKWYGDAYSEFPVEYTKLFDTFTSRKAFEEDVGMSGLGLAQIKPEAASVSYDSMQQGFINRYTHVTYALGFLVSREAFEDDQYDVVAEKRAKALAFSMRQTKEIVGANVYNNAFTAGFTGGDGVVLCSTAHPNVAGGTQSNVGTAATLSEASLEAMVIAMGKWTNDRGLRINVMPKTLIIPVDLEFEANRILGTEYRVVTSNNDINALRTLQKFPGGIAINHYLTDTNGYFIRTNIPDGMKHFEREADNFSEDNDFDTTNAKFKAYGRYSFGWTDWRGVMGNAGA
jgi:phage major head subunit gpT-like protein